MSRRMLVPALALAALATAAPTASATEFWVTPDESRTGGDCLTRETACALGYAQQRVPAIPFLTPPIDVHQLLLLPGVYDRDDFSAGTGSTGQPLVVRRALTIQGAPGELVPVLDVSGIGDGIDGVELQYGGVLRDVTIAGTSGRSIVRAVGYGPAPKEAALPAILDRVTIVAEGSADRAANLIGNVLVRNSIVVYDGDEVGEGITSGATPDGGSPRLVGNTVLAPKGRAVAIYGAKGEDYPDHHELVGNIIRGNADISVYAGGGVVPETGPITLDVQHNALRAADGSSIETFGTVTVNRKGNVGIGDDIPIDDDAIPLPGSVLVDAGIADPDLGPFDFFGADRIFGSAPDIGAVEFGSTVPAAPTTLATPGATPAPTPQQNPAPANATLPAAGTKLSAPKTVTRKRLTGGKGLALRAVVAAPVKKATVELIRITKGKGGAKQRRLAVATATGKGTELAFALKVKASKLAKGKQKLTLRYTFVDAAGTKTVVDKPVTVR